MHHRKTLEENFIERFGQNKFFKSLLKMYKRVYSPFFDVKKEMTFWEKIKFILRNRFEQVGCRNIIILKTGHCKRNFFSVYGSQNEISIGYRSKIEHVTFEIHGDNNRILIGNNVVIKHSIIHIGDNGSFLSIGDDTSIGYGLRMSILESAKVKIGNDCMFSTNTSIMNSDAHSIINLKNNQRINKAKDVSIGNHVWFGQDVTVLKGVEIQDNVVIGNRSLLTKGVYESNNIYVGTPARVLRGGVQWLHEKI